jgi:hypothetical protein
MQNPADFKVRIIPSSSLLIKKYIPPIFNETLMENRFDKVYAKIRQNRLE